MRGHDPGHIVGRVRFVFSVPSSAKSWFGEEFYSNLPRMLAYVEWFTAFDSLRPSQTHRMYKISPQTAEGQRVASVIPVDLISQSVHLIPVFGPVAPAAWKSSTVLDDATEFLVNRFSDRFQYCTLV